MKPLPAIISSAILAGALFSGCAKQAEPTAPTPNEPKPATNVPTTTMTETKPMAAAPKAPALTPQQGLVEATKLIATKAVSSLTTPANVETGLVALPPAVESLRTPLAAAGQSNLLSSFSDSLSAGTADVLKAAPAVLEGWATELGYGGAVSALTGNTGVTQYLEGSARDAVAAKLMPTVKEAVAEYGMDGYLDTINGALKSEKAGGLLGGLSAMTGVKLPTGDVNIEDYLVNQSMSLLFSRMAVEETKLRADPVGRSAEIFDAVASLGSEEN